MPLVPQTFFFKAETPSTNFYRQEWPANFSQLSLSAKKHVKKKKTNVKKSQREFLFFKVSLIGILICIETYREVRLIYIVDNLYKNFLQN